MEARAHLVLLYCGGWVDSKNVYWASFCTLASQRRVFKPSDRGCHTHVVKSHHQTRLQPRLETGEAVNFTIDQWLLAGKPLLMHCFSFTVKDLKEGEWKVAGRGGARLTLTKQRCLHGCVRLRDVRYTCCDARLGCPFHTGLHFFFLKQGRDGSIVSDMPHSVQLRGFSFSQDLFVFGQFGHFYHCRGQCYTWEWLARKGSEHFHWPVVYRGRNLGPHRALSRQGKESRQLRLLEFRPILYRTSAKLDSEELAR